MRICIGHQTSEEDEDYFTARDEQATEATTTGARKATSDSPSVANPLKPRELEAHDRGHEERQRIKKVEQERMRRTGIRDWGRIMGGESVETHGRGAAAARSDRTKSTAVANTTRKEKRKIASYKQKMKTVIERLL
jgi:hypothetical protein